MRRWTGFFLGCLWCAAALGGTATLPPGAVLIEAGTPKPDAALLALDAGAVVARAGRGDVDGAFAQLQAIEDPWRRELTAARVIEALPRSMDARGFELLARLETMSPRVFRRHEETAADWFLPVFDIAAKARARRHLADLDARAAAWLQAFDADPGAAAKRLLRPEGDPSPTPGTSASQRALVFAIERATPAQLARIAEGVAEQKSILPSAAQARLALRSGDARQWTLALQQAEAVDVLPLFAQAVDTLGAKAGRAWLEAAARRPEYASAATLALARMQAAAAKSASGNVTATKALVNALDDPAHGAEAAAVLANAPDALAIADRLIADPASGATRLANVALLLRLADSDAARTRLAALREDARLPAHLRTELQR